jgi:hypothetical protein
MTGAERAVVMKRCNLCMADAHTGMMTMKPTMKNIEDHLMSGLTAGEQATFRRLIMSCNAAEAAVGMKILENCCMYGMAHSKS